MVEVDEQGAPRPAAPSWSHFPHGADIGIRGTGPSPAAAFAQAAYALTAVVVDPDRVVACGDVDIAVSGASLDDLFYAWIDALVFAMATRRMLFSSFDVRIDGHRLAAHLRGEPVDRQRHAPAVEVKGPTFTALSVIRDAAGTWTAQCVVDV
jgi:SHS2 domain-containing protein